MIECTIQSKGHKTECTQSDAISHLEVEEVETHRQICHVSLSWVAEVSRALDIRWLDSQPGMELSVKYKYKQILTRHILISVIYLK